MANKIDIPNGWEVKKLGEIGNFLKGKGIKKDELCDNGLPCVTYGQIYTSYDFYTDKFTSFIPINLKPYTTEIYQNDILFTGSGETKEEIGKSIAYIGKEYAYAGGDIIILRQDKIISIFITYYLNSIGRKQLNRLGQGDSVVHIYKSILESVKIPVPPLAEQEKIAEILSLWDKAIEHTKELIAYKEKQKKGLMQNLLTGKKRLHGWTDDWKNIELGEVLTERNIYAEKNGKYHHVSLTKYGIIQKNDKYDRDYLVTKQGKEYKITRKDDICYNNANLKFGVICKNNYGVGIFSPIYITFEVNSDYNTDFIAFVLTQQSFIDKIRRYEEGTVYERKAVKPKDFLLGRILIPTLFNEQKAIADILLKADKEIELLNKQLELYTEQKKGLMQNLLTGRVKV